MTDIPREAIDAALDAWMVLVSHTYADRMSVAITAALPFLAPKPSESDYERISDLIADWPDPETELPGAIARFAAAVRAEEREACAKVASEGSFPFAARLWIHATKKEMTEHVALAISAAIRARGQA